MTFPASAISARIEGLPGPFPMKSADGSRMPDVDRELLEILIETGKVCGIGSNQRFRTFQLTAPADEVDRAIGDVARNVRLTRSMTPIDLLMRMSSARKTTFCDRFDVVRAGRTVKAAVYQHKGINLERRPVYASR